MTATALTEDLAALDHGAVLEAARAIRGQLLRTPTLPAPKLSQLTGAEVFVKYENLQVTGSFKDRGALVKLMSLPPEERQRGIIAMSAGNHAQSVAYHAQRLGIPYLLWLAAVITSCGEENVSLLKVSGDFQLFSSLPGNLFQSRPVSAEEVESQRFFRLLLFLAFPHKRGGYRLLLYLTIFIHPAHFGLGGSPM